MATVNQPFRPAKVRPTGVTILAVLEAISALILLVTGAGIAFLGGSTGIFGFIFVIVGGIMLLIGLFELVIAYGLWAGKGWARVIAMILAILSLLFGLIGTIGGSITSLLVLVFSLVILLYLNQSQVKAYFA